MYRFSSYLCGTLLLTVALAGCAKAPAPTVPAAAPPGAVPGAATSESSSPPTLRVDEPTAGTMAVPEDAVSGQPLEDLNRDSPLVPVFFASDRSDLDPQGRQTIAANAQVLKMHPTWTITIEGHCDERGTAEYNLALGDLRAASAKAYLVALGIEPGRIRTISYGKEFPFDTGHDELAWGKNRRAQFVITSK